MLEKDYSRYMTIRWKRRLFRNNKNSAVNLFENRHAELKEYSEIKET
jgi:hypothetical protein